MWPLPVSLFSSLSIGIFAFLYISIFSCFYSQCLLLFLIISVSLRITRCISFLFRYSIFFLLHLLFYSYTNGPSPLLCLSFFIFSFWLHSFTASHVFFISIFPRSCHTSYLSYFIWCSFIYTRLRTFLFSSSFFTFFFHFVLMSPLFSFLLPY